MIKSPIVFVLGAGASVPFGFPTGAGLKNIIIENLNREHSKNEIIEQEDDFTKEDIEIFRKQLSFSGKSSVDAFLEHRKELIPIGKYAIAQALIPFEDPDLIFKKGHWYEYLYNKLNASFEDFDKNQISIITYNYDRSFEYYLFTALRNSYGKSSDACAAKMANIPIIHVHGSLGSLQWQDGEKREFFKGKYTIRDLNVAAQRIRIIHEDIDINSDKLFMKAHDLLEKASSIYFIGFGYNKTNIDRLRIPLAKRLRGTAFGLEEAERIYISTMFKDKSILLADKDTDALLFLRKHIQF